MVSHGRDRKRRAGRIGKVKLRQRKWVRFNPKPIFGDARLRKHWDPSKSASVNLTAMGLLALPNDLNGSRQSSNCEKIEPTKSTVVELFDIPESDKPSRRSKFPLEKEEEEYIANCMSKWGDNYTQMFRDVKGVNKMQHTETQLRKMGSRYLLLTPSQRRLPVPENIQDLLPSRDD